MKTPTRNVIFLSVILVAVSSFRASASLNSAPAIQVTISLPSPALDLSDLDARDEFNRPIRHSAPAQILERLFVTNLNRMLMENLTPLKQQLMVLLSEKWDTLAGFLQRQFNRFNKNVDAWFSSKKFSDPFRNCAVSLLGWMVSHSSCATVRSTNFNPVSLFLASTLLRL